MVSVAGRQVSGWRIASDMVVGVSGALTVGSALRARATGQNVAEASSDDETDCGNA